MRKKPAYQDIAETLRGAIRDGEYAPGHKLPSETELMTKYGVSRGTVREAFALLHAEWITEARRGSGVYVRTFNPIKRNAAERLARKNWDAGRSIWGADIGDGSRRTMLDTKEAEAPKHIARGFGLRPGSRVWTSSVRYDVEGQPIQLAYAYLPADLVGDSGDVLKQGDPWADYAMLRDAGHTPVKVREEIRTRLPLADEIQELKITSGTPVILIAQTAFDAEGRPVEIAELVMDSGSYMLEYEFAV